MKRARLVREVVEKDNCWLLYTKAKDNLIYCISKWYNRHELGFISEDISKYDIVKMESIAYKAAPEAFNDMYYMYFYLKEEKKISKRHRNIVYTFSVSALTFKGEEAMLEYFIGEKFV